MAKSISDQLLDAFLSAKDTEKLTLEDLLARAQKKKRNGKSILECDFTSLSRKLHGKQGLTVSEALTIAEALGVELNWAVDSKVKAS